MNKKILVCSILVLAMLLLMPSIPAIQQKTVEDKAYSDFVEELKNVDYDDIKERKELFEDDFWDHPIVYFLGYIAFFRVMRGLGLTLISSSYLQYGQFFEIFNPIIFIRGLWLIGTGFGFSFLLQAFCYIMGWEW